MLARVGPSLLWFVSLMVFLAAARVAAAKTEVVAGPMIGHVGPTSARIWMQLNTTERVTLRCYDIRNRELGSITGDVEGPAPFIFDGPVSGLEPERTYRIEVLFDNKPSGVPDIMVRTAPAVGDPATWTLAFGSCFNPETHPQLPVFRNIEALKPRAFLLLGNAGYLPYKEDAYPRTRRASVKFFNAFHEKIRKTPDLQGLLRSTATYAVWDDHDFGADNAGKDWVFAKESWTAFTRFWPNPDYGTPETPGVFCSFSFGDVDVFLLDARMFRDKDSAPDRKTMLGAEQLAWLKKGLQESKATFKLIAGPSQFLTSEAGHDTWGNFKQEQEEFVGWLFKKQITGVLFLSGDRHFGELTARIPDPKAVAEYPLYDLTSSPLGASVAGEEEYKENAGRVGAVVNEVNFGTVDFGGPKGKRHATLRLRSVSGEVKVERVILAEELKGQ